MPVTKNRIVWACDKNIGFSQILGRADQLRDYVGIIKLNSLYIAYGRMIVDRLYEAGFSIWVDLKFKDIPVTVELEVQNALEIPGVCLCTIHLSGTHAMIAAATKGAKASAAHDGHCGSVLGITVLTSVSQEEFNEEIPGTIEDCVYRRTKKGVENGIDGIVCSGHEVDRMRQEFGSDLIIACPGISFDGRVMQGQARVTTPYQAIKAGADLLVMGRDLDPYDESKLVEIHRQIVAGMEAYQLN